MQEFSIFDIVGPNMIGPSSSHTAGACKIGRVAHKLAEGKIQRVVFYLHGSFAKTYQGHGTDKALLGGVLGFDPDDERIKHSFSIAEEKGLRYHFQEADLGDVHPNTVKMEIENDQGKILSITGSSIGGGNVVVTEIDGVKLSFSGEYPTLIISYEDQPGVIARVTTILSLYNINIAYMRSYRKQKGKNAYMIIETDSEIAPDLFRHIQNVDLVDKAFLVSMT